MSDHPNTFNAKQSLQVGDKSYHYFDLKVAEKAGLAGVSKLPKSLKVLLENLLRFEDGNTVTAEDVQAFANWLTNPKLQHEIAYHPARVLMQDFTGVPAVVDLAAMRDAMVRLGGEATKINPLCPVDLVIDHSVQVDNFGNTQAFTSNVEREMQRNQERYEFLRWGQDAFDNFGVVPPGTGICHQVNLEYLGQSVWTQTIDGNTYAYPDTLVGTDSHTTMINGLGILGWGVGGIEAEAAMLGQPISMLIPNVVGFCLTGKLKEGVTATDLVLTVTQMLREKGVVGKFVEFYGEGLAQLPLADRATIANMAPEYGATCGFFPIDGETLRYLELSGRSEETIALVEAYCKAQGMWFDPTEEAPQFSDTLSLNMNTVEPSLAGPKRPQDRVTLPELPKAVDAFIDSLGKTAEIDQSYQSPEDFSMHHGDVVIAAITSCTNTSNPNVMIAAGLLAKKAAAKGLQRKPWVKPSLAPGSKVVTDYLKKTNLLEPLEQLGFYLVGYGCTTCIGNSGPLTDSVTKTIQDNDITVCSVLSGNRNFEGRIHPLVKANWLASPPLVVAYALAGTTRIDLQTEPLGTDESGNPVYLKDIWPSSHEVAEAVAKVDRGMFIREYADAFKGDATWQALDVTPSNTYDWQQDSTYIQKPPFFVSMTTDVEPSQNINNANILALLGDSITTDHISPAGAIKGDSPAGIYLREQGVDQKEFNSYGSRRGNHEVMMRGTFANIRIRNEMVPGTEGGFTRYIPDNTEMPIYDAAMRYQENNTPLVVVAGKEYGTGSSRDWAAKGTLLLGVKAVVAESFERIHRSNLIGMGVLPLRFPEGITRQTLKLDGSETISIEGMADGMSPAMTINMTVNYSDGRQENVPLLCRIDTEDELAYYQNGGILQYVLRNMLAEQSA